MSMMHTYINRGDLLGNDLVFLIDRGLFDFEFLVVLPVMLLDLREVRESIESELTDVRVTGLGNHLGCSLLTSSYCTLMAKSFVRLDISQNLVRLFQASLKKLLPLQCSVYPQMAF